MTCTYVGMNKNSYSPEIVSGPLANMPVSDVTIVARTTILLQYPFDVPTTTLQLRNPELNDLFLFQAYRVQEYSRGNSQIIFRDSTWFKTRIFNWAFTALTRQNRDDIISFVRLTAGKYVLVTDFYSLTNKCLIINPDNPITQETPGCGYTWKVDLQKAIV